MLYRAFPLRGKLIVTPNLLPLADSAFDPDAEPFQSVPANTLMAVARLPLDLPAHKSLAPCMTARRLYRDQRPVLPAVVHAGGLTWAVRRAAVQ